ncbi:MAG: hypothetical protein AAFV96_09795, partial [Pseudomonadota bacterium]
DGAATEREHAARALLDEEDDEDEHEDFGEDGAMTLGIANKFLEPYAGAVLAKVLVLVFIILFIQKRPRGMFALRGRAVET